MVAKVFWAFGMMILSNSAIQGQLGRALAIAVIHGILYVQDEVCGIDRLRFCNYVAT
jgi:hypothetical protein